MRPFGIHRFMHPQFGELAFEHTSYVPDGHPNDSHRHLHAERRHARRCSESQRRDTKGRSALMNGRLTLSPLSPSPFPLPALRRMRRASCRMRSRRWGT